MELTNEQLDVIAQRVAEKLALTSQGVGEVPVVDAMDGVNSLPAYRVTEGVEEVVEVPIPLLAKPSLDAAEAANQAATNANEKANDAYTKALQANEAASLANRAANSVNEVKQSAEAATNAANTATLAANQATSNANTATNSAYAAAEAADVAKAAATEVAGHPTYVGTDNYVYAWNTVTKSYDRTNIYVKGEAFNISRVYDSVSALEADAGNTSIKEGAFVLVNTNDVENPDNARLYVKVKNPDGSYRYNFLVDMSGAIGFTGKTPQFTKGIITTGEAGSDVQLSLSESGTDPDGNPVMALNLVIPRGNPGVPFKVLGHYDTLDALKAAVPDGMNAEGVYAVGSNEPYEYYAWARDSRVAEGQGFDDGTWGWASGSETGWINQGRMQGTDGKSAYQVAVDAGFSGTEAEWLASLKGEKGEPGIQGPKGEVGPVGPQGVKGDTGATGAQGVQGPMGPTGPQGPTGATGNSFLAGVINNFNGQPQTPENLWWRTVGNSGWYSDTHGGGIHMTDASYVRVFGSKAFWCDNNIVGGYIQSRTHIDAANGFYQQSDRRLKETISSVKWSLDKLSNLSIDLFYKYKEIEKTSEPSVQIGCYADEIKVLAPEFISESEDANKNKVDTVDYSKVGLMALKGVQLLYERVRGIEEVLGIENTEGE